MGFLPLASDLTVRAEPAVPDAAFEIDELGDQTEAAIAAEKDWKLDMFQWGRDGWRQVARLCRQAKDKMPNLAVQCPPRSED